MEFELSKRVIKELSRQSISTRKRVMDAIAKLPDGDVRPIKGYNEKFRLRVGDWRVVYYQLDEHTIVIERFGARGGIYQGGF